MWDNPKRRKKSQWQKCTCTISGNIWTAYSLSNTEYTPMHWTVFSRTASTGVASLWTRVVLSCCRARGRLLNRTCWGIRWAIESHWKIAIGSFCNKKQKHSQQTVERKSISASAQNKLNCLCKNINFRKKWP